MRLGLIARADNTGLGMQTFEFYRHMPITKTMVVDISKLNGNKQYPERYIDHPNGELQFVQGIPSPHDYDKFLEGLDVVFVAESAYNHYFYERARELGVKTAVQYNYEFFDWFNPAIPKPDMFVAPSRWHWNDVQALCDAYGLKHVYLHCPVNRQALAPRNSPHAATFLHTAGRSAAHDRNGTETVIRAAELLKTPAHIVIHFQGEQGLAHQMTKSIPEYQAMVNPHKQNVTIITNEYENYADVYHEGDVLLLPRRYGGNCLPVNEALSIGMPVIMPDISPNNAWLPEDWLVPARQVGIFTPRTVVDIYDVSPQDLADQIDRFYRMSEDHFRAESARANELGNQISWESLRPKYLEALESLCTL